MRVYWNESGLERGETRNKHENHFDLPLLIFKALFHIIQNVYRTKGECHLMPGCCFVSEHVCWTAFRYFLLSAACSQKASSSRRSFHTLLSIRSAGQLKWISFSFLLYILMLLLFTIAGAKLSAEDYLHSHSRRSIARAWKEKAMGLLWNSAYAQWPLTCLSSLLSRCSASCFLREEREDLGDVVKRIELWCPQIWLLTLLLHFFTVFSHLIEKISFVPEFSSIIVDCVIDKEPFDRQ